MAFQFFSARVTYRREVRVVRYSANHWAVSTSLTCYFPFFLNIAAVSDLCVAAEVYGSKEDAVVPISAQDQTMLKSEQRQLNRPEIKETFSQQAVTCE